MSFIARNIGSLEDVVELMNKLFDIIVFLSDPNILPLITLFVISQKETPFASMPQELLFEK